MRTDAPLATLLNGRVNTVLLDLDGTVYHEDHALPGAVEFITELERRGIRYACLTNGPGSPEGTAKRLQQMGVKIDADHVYTAAAAAADYVLEHFRRPRVFNLATEGLAELLEGRVTWVERTDEPCDVVIAGAPANEFATEQRQRTALVLLRGGAKLVGICADRVYPSPRGLEFGSGAFCAMLSYASNVQPVFAGKPQPIFFHELCRRLGVETDQCLLVGDNLESDIAGAKALGMRTVLTLTGVTTRQQVKALAPDRAPDMIVNDLSELL